MKKSLLLAALLLSGAAQAETWVCTEEVVVQLFAEDGFLVVQDYKSSNEIGGTLIIDTLQGYKLGFDGPWSESECKNTTQTVVTCSTIVTNEVPHTVTVTEKDGRLSFLRVATVLGQMAILSSGYCSKV
ncbi:MAG: hypothetical protein O3B02_03630 [Proteobacteria bacterium]|nr:hypothetical protein [Pseudomonadota bacterium]